MSRASGGERSAGDVDAPDPAASMSNVRLLLSRVGAGYFPLALGARLPFAMMVVGVLTLVVAARGSIELGGLTSAMAGLGCAVFGPLVGAAADRYGQRRVLLAGGIANSALLGVFAWIAFSPLPDWPMLLTSLLIGATTPQTSPMSRSRLVGIIASDLPVMRGPRLISGVLAYESAADEVVFVFGPVVVGILASTMGAAAPVVAAAVLTLVFVTAFALHRTSEPPKSPEERAATLEPASALARPGLVVTVIGVVWVGLYFGSMLTSLTAFMQDRGAAEHAGLLYGAMGVGSAILALSVALLPPRFSLRARWLVFAGLIAAGGIGLQFVTDVPGMALSLVLMGIGIGPTLVTLYSFGAQRSPEGRSNTVMMMLGSGIMVGQAAGAALTGVIAADLGTHVALTLPLTAAVLVLLTGGVNWVLSASRTAESAGGSRGVRVGE